MLLQNILGFKKFNRLMRTKPAELKRKVQNIWSPISSPFLELKKMNDIDFLLYCIIFSDLLESSALIL